MRVLIASSHPYIPQIAGGAQSSSHELALNLQSRGHSVALLCGLLGKGRLGLRSRVMLKLTGRKAAMDEMLGYPVHRSWFAWEAGEEVCAAFRPHAIILQSGHPVRMAEAMRPSGAVIIPYFRNVEFRTDLGGDPRELRAYRCIANSQFTADAYRRAFGIESVVIHPFIKPERYRTQTDGSSVLFINPVPEKGVDLAIELARRCPDIPFTFVEAWTLDAKARSTLKAALAALRNVTLVPRRRDMRELYAKARLLLAPSRYEEAFGRIVAEAHVSGIPVLASRRGGLPEAVGPGGVLLDIDEPIEAWVGALEKLWTDQAHHKQLSEAALAYSGRPELDIEKQLDQLIGIIEREVAARSLPPETRKSGAGV